MSVCLLICSAAAEFAVVWWFLTREYRRPASLRRFLSGLALILCLFFSPLFQISMIRQIIAQKELANTIAHAWVILVSLCGLVFMFTILLKLGNRNNSSSSADS